MRINTVTIINGRALGLDSLTFKTRSAYEDHTNGMIDYVADKELAVEFNHEAFSTNETERAVASMFCSDKFKSVILSNCIAWKESGVITINILEGNPLNIESSIDAENNS